jgi:hypothetical protein
MDPDPGGPKTRGSGWSGSATLPEAVAVVGLGWLEQAHQVLGAGRHRVREAGGVGQANQPLSPMGEVLDAGLGLCTLATGSRVEVLPKSVVINLSASNVSKCSIFLTIFSVKSIV